MTIIDLLNKIAKGEELPKKIKFNNYIFNLDKINHLYRSEYDRDLTFHLKQCQEYALNEEIEIIEEKEIEEIPYHYNFGYIDCGDLKREVVEELSKNFNYFKDKINELVRTVNEIKKEDK